MFWIAFTVFLIYAVANSSGQPPSCPHGWVYNDSSCYAFISDYPMDWNEAMMYCRALQAKLVEIETASENGFLRLHLLDNKATGHYWIGLNDILSEGEWVWMSYQQTPTYTDWSPGQPDNYQQHEDCTLLWGATRFHWDDALCSYKENFICEKESSEGINIVG
ncbi:perlucin-like protein [Saccostrea cucullata]|uniref:perlucin-like protein n=1 Tax=Saccostrea cuccullata TaxID=36930 RepID=UPI002ED10E7C